MLSPSATTPRNAVMGAGVGVGVGVGEGAGVGVGVGIGVGVGVGVGEGVGVGVGVGVGSGIGWPAPAVTTGIEADESVPVPPHATSASPTGPTINIRNMPTRQFDTMIFMCSPF